jgi:hypothetical protein
MTALSWHGWCISGGMLGSPAGTNRRYEADAGSSSGTSTMFIPRHEIGCSEPGSPPRMLPLDRFE